MNPYAETLSFQSKNVDNETQVKPATSNTEDKTDEVTPTGATTNKNPLLFNTPERKRIYAAFTFESPSPASRRFASWRESSLSRLPALSFDASIFDDL